MFNNMKIDNIRHILERSIKEIPHDCKFLKQKGIESTNNCFVWFIKVDSIVFIIKPISTPSFCASWISHENLLIGEQCDTQYSLSNNICDYNIIFNLSESNNRTLKTFVEKTESYINKLNNALNDFKNYKNLQYQNNLNEL